jgi:hypothetical protein
MAKVILGMTMSLDGFINDPDGSVEALYPDLAAWRETEPGFEGVDASRIQLERIKAMALPGGRTHIEFRITK